MLTRLTVVIILQYMQKCNHCDVPLKLVVCCTVIESCLTLCSPMDGSTPGSSVLHNLPEFAQFMSIKTNITLYINYTSIFKRNKVMEGSKLSPK